MLKNKTQQNKTKTAVWGGWSGKKKKAMAKGWQKERRNNEQKFKMGCIQVLRHT